MPIVEEASNLRVVDDDSILDYLNYEDPPDLTEEEEQSNAPTISKTSDKLSTKHHHNG